MGTPFFTPTQTHSDMRTWRTLLFVPGNRRRMLDKLTSLPADGFIFDIEDTVPDAEKPVAREMVKAYIPTVPGTRSWVRVNSVRSGFLHEDLEAFIGLPGLAGVVAPKQDSRDDVVTVDNLICSVELRKSHPVGSTPIIVMIESATAALDSRRIMTASPRIESMVYGGGEDGDMNVSLGATWSSSGPEMMFVRQHSLVSARAAGIEWPLDGVFSNIRDHAGFQSDTELSRRLGYRGRTVIHPDQLVPANQIYTPSSAQVDYSRRVVAAYEEAVSRGMGSTTVEGKLVDVAMVKTAQRLLSQHQSIQALEALTGRLTS
jgi:citrate lyase subunit beta / citryl-CoA lyase